MAYRWRGRFFEVDPENPAAEGICQRCNFRFNLKNLVWQYDYQGTSQLQNTRLLVCGRPGCYDVPNPQLAPYILPPDPPPVFNARPENYVLDESSWLATQDGDNITAEDGSTFTTALPNPDSDAVANENSINEEATVSITTEDGVDIVTEAGDGNPLNIDPNPPAPGTGN